MKKLSIKQPKNIIEEGCVASCLGVLGHKWTGLILTELTTGPKRFSQLERSLDGISPRTLAQRLDDLVKYKIVSKAAFAEVPPRIEYTLTQKGEDFIPVLQQMATWGTKYPA